LGSGWRVVLCVIRREVSNISALSGGTNLRVGFIEIPDRNSDATKPNGSSGKTHHDATNPRSTPDVIRHLEKSWPIGEHLKNRNAYELFDWIGSCIAGVVREGQRTFSFPSGVDLPLGVTFSFPVSQPSLSQANLTSMGKGFAIEANSDLGNLVKVGYEKHRATDLPSLEIVAILNDSVSTLISFIYSYEETAQRKASMGLIVGTGCNATVPLKWSCLHYSKRPKHIHTLPGEDGSDLRIAVNTEWSINGTAPPLRDLGLISKWDEELDAAGEVPGFQPLEYMTAGRYLGELGRIIFLDFMTKVKGLDADIIPPGLKLRHSLSTTFLSHYKPLNAPRLIDLLEGEFPTASRPSFAWTEDLAEALFHIAQAIELRAAGIIAAAIIALLVLADDIPTPQQGKYTRSAFPRHGIRELGVGYTGGCIVHFQNYLNNCQKYLDDILDADFEGRSPVRVVLRPCHDGGIAGAGILAAAALSLREVDN
jgi:hexokinase